LENRQRLESALFDLINKHSDLNDVVEMVSDVELIKLIDDFTERNDILEEGL